MSMIFFKIGSTDLTANADIQNYKVNKIDETEDWTDGNFIVHRAFKRTRVKGSFKLGFKNSTDWANFQTLLTSAINADGYYSVTLYVNNTGTEETINVYLELTNSDKWDLVNSRFWRVVTVNLIQR